jgi:hypothetical protein
MAPGANSSEPEPFCSAERLNEEPDVGKPLVRFCEGVRHNWCMAEILWHRRETRRQTENTNVMPVALGGLISTRLKLPNRTQQKSRWVFPQEYAEELLPTLVREVEHLRWQEEINEFKLANQHFDIKHILHHEPNAIEIFLFLKFFVLTFISLFLSQREPRLQKKTVLLRTSSM